mgnify:CR=1 FL=1
METVVYFSTGKTPNNLYVVSSISILSISLYKYTPALVNTPPKISTAAAWLLFPLQKPRGQRAAEVCRSPLGGLFSHRRAHPCRDKNRAYKADSVRAHAGDFRGRSAYERLRCRQARYRAIRCWLAIPPVHKSALLPAASARKRSLRANRQIGGLCRECGFPMYGRQ